MKTPLQLSMLTEPKPTVSLRDYDWIVLSSSAGKDSLAMIDEVYAQAVAEGCAKRLVVIHCDLGKVEWSGTRDLAEKQAERYGIRFEVVSRNQGDLLQHVRERGKWPSPKQRYCTSDHKRSQVRRVLTMLTDEHRRRCKTWHYKDSHCKILSCMGMRADESPARAKLPTLAVNASASNGLRTVTDWLPLHSWSEGDVWERLHSCRAKDLIHFAYALGMPRLSCCFCIFAPKAALTLAGRHNPALLDEYVKVESEIGHSFRVNLSMADVKAAVQSGQKETVTTWAM